ncbi:YydG family peptide modification radical SAM enzyme [Bacillus cereus BAG6X1-2]|nr:YydG family peptide modification radical SAM enzyme [Bacillus cereus BAG6X1-2]
MKSTYSTLTLHAKCTAECDMCCFGCSPQSSEYIEENKLRKIITDSKNNDVIKKISFSGGEVFMNYNLLLRLVKLAKECGKTVTCITNGYWAINEKVAFEKLKELTVNGLDQISISFDEFHHKFISTTCIANILNTCKKIGLPVSMGMVKTMSTNEGKLIDELGTSVLNTPIYIYPCLPVGAASDNIKDSEFIRMYDKNSNLKCPHGGIMAIFFNGKAYPCCSQSVIKTGLIVGDLNKKDDLDSIIKKIKNNGLLYLLRNYGFQWFIEKAENDLGINLPDKYASPCELCSLLFTKDNIQKFAPLVRERITEIKNASAQ